LSAKLLKIKSKIPTNGAMTYITQPVYSVKNNIEPNAITHIIVPVLKADFLPNFV